MKVSQEPVTLKNLLSENVFQVPLNQREYSWELEQVSDLFYDIKASTETNGHFVGSLLLYEKDKGEKIFEIIDGQQRLTTLFLILYSVKKSIEGSDKRKAIEKINDMIYQRSDSLDEEALGDEPRLTTGKRDKNLFRAILKGEEILPYKDGRKKSHKLLLNALEIFLDFKMQQIKKERGIEGIVEFANKVKAVEFIVMTAEKKSDKILLFKTLNARGIELSESDLIKNEVCSNLKGISEDDAVELWDEMRQTLEKVKANTDSFLFHFINSQPDSIGIRKKIEAERHVKSEKDSAPPVPEKYLFDVYEDKLKSISNTEKFLNDLRRAADNYTELIAPPKSNIYLNGLRAMNITKCYPLLLRGKEILNKKNFELLTKAVECISFRHSIIRSDPKDLESFYYTLLSKLKSDEDIQVIIEDIRQHVTMRNESKFESEFTSATPKSNVAKMILFRMCEVQHESIDPEKGDVWLEHIMPQSPTGNWLKLKNQDPELYDFSVHRIGNLTLLQKGLNRSASNRDFDLKLKDYYEKSRLQMTRDLSKFSSWTYDTIHQRQDELHKIAKNIWTL